MSRFCYVVAWHPDVRQAVLRIKDRDGVEEWRARRWSFFGAREVRVADVSADIPEVLAALDAVDPMSAPGYTRIALDVREDPPRLVVIQTAEGLTRPPLHDVSDSIPWPVLPARRFYIAEWSASMPQEVHEAVRAMALHIGQGCQASPCSGCADVAFMPIGTDGAWLPRIARQYVTQCRRPASP